MDIKQYPPAIIDALYADGRFRRDRVFRASLQAGMAFLWSDLHALIRLDRLDRAALSRGLREGLNEGITIPFARLGDCLGSCTFAGVKRPQQAEPLDPAVRTPRGPIGAFLIHIRPGTRDRLRWTGTYPDMRSRVPA